MSDQIIRTIDSSEQIEAEFIWELESQLQSASMSDEVAPFTMGGALLAAEAQPRAMNPKERGREEDFVDGDEDGREVPKKRKRVLACPVCKMLRQDGSMVMDGNQCNGGHIVIDNERKIWKCLQCKKALSINGSWVTTCKRHFNDDGICVNLQERVYPLALGGPLHGLDLQRKTEMLLQAFPVQQGLAFRSEAAPAAQQSAPAHAPAPVPQPQLPANAPQTHSRAGSCAGSGVLCSECAEPAMVQCEACRGSYFCPNCDLKVHNAFRVLRTHRRVPLNMGMKGSSGRQQGEVPVLRCFPASGECHAAQVVRLCKQDDMLALFPSNEIADCTYELTMGFEGIQLALVDYHWESRRCVTTRLPSYYSIVGPNHGPHHTSCMITMKETKFQVDPPLRWQYTFEHAVLLDKVTMLEKVNSTLQNLVTNMAPPIPTSSGATPWGSVMPSLVQSDKLPTFEAMGLAMNQAARSSSRQE